jgi:hypothetical protein
MDLAKTLIVAAFFPAFAASSQAAAPELIRASGETQFRALQAAPAFGRAYGIPAAPLVFANPAPANPPVLHFDEPVFLAPKLVPVLAGDMGSQVGSFVLAQRLDTQRGMLTRQLGSQTWDIGVAGDSAFKVLYFTFRQPKRLLIVRINNIKDLIGNGVNVTLDSKTTYNFKVSIDYFSFDPVRDSTLHIDAVNGTAGQSYDDLSIGGLLDAWKAKSYVFNAGGNEFWTLYTTDVDPNTNQLAKTRSLVFVHYAGTSSKFYTMAEGALKAGQPYALSLGDTPINLVKTAAGLLQINSVDDSLSQSAARPESVPAATLNRAPLAL